MKIWGALAVAAILLAGCDDTPKNNGGGTAPNPPTAPVAPLSANDVSWLFPPPASASDMASVIAIKDVTSPDPQNPAQRDPVWSPAAFQNFLSIANGSAGAVSGSSARIGLPKAAQRIDAWQIAGIRIDAGAPGLADAVRAQFGQSPQIRLILHPVILQADGTPQVQDIAAHLIFNFTLSPADAPAVPGCLPKQKPDLVAFREIVAELAALRDHLANGDFGAKVITANTPLGIHPGLANPATAARVKQEMLAFLERHVSAPRLSAMAVMGLPPQAVAPWIFVSMLGVPPGADPTLPQGGYIAVHSPTLDGTQIAQMLTPLGDSPRVVPAPHTFNSQPITCLSGVQGPAAVPVATRQGFATAEILNNTALSAARVKTILARIEDPTASHFFNTDCVSCHTETRLGMERLNATSVPGLDPAVMPNGPYNVRNFGWSPPIEGPVQGTATRRTAAETQAVVEFINNRLAAE